MVSVIVPYKDAEGWIARCANSLRQQKGDFEFLFVNDGSGGSFEVDDRFVLLDNEHAPGVSGARNTGLDHAHGEWITFLDADDEMLPGASEKYNGLTADINQFNHLRLYRQDTLPRAKYVNPSGWYDLMNPPRQWCMVWNKLYKAELLKEIRFKEGMQFGEDELFNLECLNKARWLYHSDEPIILRHFNNKKSLAHSRDEGALLRQARELEDFLKTHQDRDIRRLVCLTLSDHWKSGAYGSIFYGG